MIWSKDRPIFKTIMGVCVHKHAAIDRVLKVYQVKLQLITDLVVMDGWHPSIYRSAKYLKWIMEEKLIQWWGKLVVHLS